MNELKHIAEFRSALADYNLSASAQQTLADTPLVLLVGPSGGGGRNTIIARLLETGRYHYILSDTTREIRVKDGQPVEKNGREYWFRTEDEMLSELRRGEFVEAAIIHEQQVSGISVRELAKARQNHLTAITDIERAGADTIHKLKPTAVILFVTPPNFEEWMRRLRGRSDLPESEIRRRIDGACREFQAVLDCDYYDVVVNDELDRVVTEIDRLASGELHDPARNQAGIQIVRQLLQEARAYLEQE